MLINSVLGLLPQLVRNVIIGEARAVEHEDLEEVFYAEAQLGSLNLKVTLLFGVARLPCDLDCALCVVHFDPLRDLHLVLCEGGAVLAYEDSIAVNTSP